MVPTFSSELQPRGASQDRRPRRCCCAEAAGATVPSGRGAQSSRAARRPLGHRHKRPGLPSLQRPRAARSGRRGWTGSPRALRRGGAAAEARPAAPSQRSRRSTRELQGEGFAKGVISPPRRAEAAREKGAGASRGRCVALTPVPSAAASLSRSRPLQARPRWCASAGREAELRSATRAGNVPGPRRLRGPMDPEGAVRSPAGPRGRAAAREGGRAAEPSRWGALARARPRGAAILSVAASGCGEAAGGPGCAGHGAGATGSGSDLTAHGLRKVQVLRELSELRH